MNNFGYVYKTTNLENGKIYIGQHRGEFAPSYKGSGLLIKRALKRHGKKSFKVEVIAYLSDRNSLNEFERSVIAGYRNTLSAKHFYNIADGGEAGGSVQMTEEIKKKISAGCQANGVGKWMEGRKLSEEHKKHIAEGLKNNAEFLLKNSLPKSEEVKQKISDKLFGRKRSVEAIEKQRRSMCSPNHVNVGRFKKGMVRSAASIAKQKEAWRLKKLAGQRYLM